MAHGTLGMVEMSRTPFLLKVKTREARTGAALKNDKLSDFQETHQLVDLLENTNASALYSIVLISVHLNVLENASFSSEMQRLTKLAKEIKQKNILLYGLIIHYQKDNVKLQETMDSAAALMMGLIRDRNPVFVGQLLVA